MNDIQLNTFQESIHGDTYLNGKYYYILHDTLFFLDIRISYSPESDRYGVWGKVFHYDQDGECFRFDMEDKIGAYLKKRTMDGLVQAGIEVVKCEGEYFYDELMKIKNSRENISLEDWKSLHVEAFSAKKDEQTYFGDISWDWKEVAQCGCDTERRRRLSELCPDCGTRLIEVFVSTPSWTWQTLCGREGMLTFCPHCQKQLRFHLECMN